MTLKSLTYKCPFSIFHVQPWYICGGFPHLHSLYLLVAAVPGDEPAVFPSRHQSAVSQHAQSKDAALVSSLDDLADTISACVTEMG